MIELSLRVNGSFKTESFMWYADETVPRPIEILDRIDAVRRLESVDENYFALRVITINANKYDLLASEMDPGRVIPPGIRREQK